VPTPLAELRRGRLVYALFPFSSEFPAELADGGGHRTVEELAGAHGGSPMRLVVEARLRPVLLLHDGTRGEHGDVACLRVNTVKPALKARADTWRRIVANQHPSFFRLPGTESRHGLRSESVIAIGSIGTVNKTALLGPPVGALSQQEMQDVNARVARALQLDLAPLISERALELLRRAGLAGR